MGNESRGQRCLTFSVVASSPLQYPRDIPLHEEVAALTQAETFHTVKTFHFHPGYRQEEMLPPTRHQRERLHSLTTNELSLSCPQIHSQNDNGNIFFAHGRNTAKKL